MDIVIKNGIVLTIDSQMRIIDNGYIAVKDGFIIEIGTKKDIELKQNIISKEGNDSQQCVITKETKIIDAKGGIIMPGFVNSHTHASMTLFRGIADDLPLMDWLNNHIFPAEAKLNPHLVYTGAKLACAEMILSGTTCFCDMYLFEDEVAKAAYESSMRAVVGEVLYDFTSPCYGNIEQGFEYAANMIKKWQSKNRSKSEQNSLITVAVEPHSTYLCQPELLIKAAALAREHLSPLIIHVAETLSESKQIKERYGVTPVKYLADIGILGPNLVACHSVHLDQSDIELYKAFNVKAAHCPESNMKLASGVAPIPKMIEKEICVGLGTDGCASNNNLNMFSEMSTAAKLHKVFTMNPEVLDAETVIKMATINGAEALGLDNITGSLEVGKRADIIVVDIDSPNMTPIYNPYSHLVYSANGSEVVTTIIDGKVVMKDRKLLTIDIKSVIDEVRKIAEFIIK